MCIYVCTPNFSIQIGVVWRLDRDCQVRKLLWVNLSKGEMRILCDVCESAAAIIFCAADEAALCRACDDQVHMCNKLASRHVRVGLGEPSVVQRCDICENDNAFFFCEIDGSSLCLQCDMIVHVGGKRTHGRYLVMRQRVKFPGDNPGNDEPGSQRLNLGEANRAKENHQNHQISPDAIQVNNVDADEKMDNKLIDLNARPQRMLGQAPLNQERAGTAVGNHRETESIVPEGYFKREPEK